MSTENQCRGGPWYNNSATLANTAMVPQVNENVSLTSIDFTQRLSSSPIPMSHDPQIVEKSPSTCVSSIRDFFKSKGLSEDSISLLCASWRSSTTKQYELYFKKWYHFCCERKVDPLFYDEAIVVEFLTFMFRNGSSYSAINTARSALSCFIVNIYGITIGNSLLVKRLMKGIFELRPPIPRYNVIWDVNIVLDYLKNFPSDKDIPLNLLTYKLVMLLALTTKQRAQTLKAISIEEFQMSNSLIIIPIRKLLKHSTQRSNKTALYLERFLQDDSICVVNNLRLYLEKTATLRGEHKQLFISFTSPYNPVSKETISRWIKRVMHEAGVDTSIFKSHSTRAASASAALRDHVPVDQILKAAGWNNCHTFHKFYKKVILPYTA